MFQLRTLIASIAGLWALCLIQNQIHPHAYIDYSNYSGDAHLVRSTVLKAQVADSGSAKAPAHDLPLFTLNQVYPFYQALRDAGSDFAAQNKPVPRKNYRIFLTGLSPPFPSFI